MKEPPRVPLEATPRSIWIKGGKSNRYSTKRKSPPPSFPFPMFSFKSGEWLPLAHFLPSYRPPAAPSLSPLHTLSISLRPGAPRLRFRGCASEAALRPCISSAVIILAEGGRCPAPRHGMREGRAEEDRRAEEAAAAAAGAAAELALLARGGKGSGPGRKGCMGWVRKVFFRASKDDD